MVVRIIGKLCFGLFVVLALSLGQAFAEETSETGKNTKDASSKKHINPGKALQQCSRIEGDKKRLTCFDELAIRFAAPTYKGRLGTVTDNFTIKKPHLLRYRSQGVIFVLYLRDKQGSVLQNFHIGGGGEKEYLIKNPGTYSLKIHGSASWEIWLDPIKN